MRTGYLFYDRRVQSFLIVLPAAAFMILFFVVPITGLLRNSLRITTGGEAADAWTVANYYRFLTTSIYLKALFLTIKIAFLTTLAAAVLAYPLAWKIAFGSARTARLLTFIVVSPLLINIVIRTFGWRIALGKTGALNWALQSSHIVAFPLDLIYTEFAIIVGSLHVFLPLMALPIATNLSKIDRALGESAATLGAGPAEIFFKIILPLTAPGLAAGATLVFTLTSSSFVLPAVLGGGLKQMLGTLIEEQTLAISDWGFGSAVAAILMVVNLLVVFLLSAAGEHQRRKRAGR